MRNERPGLLFRFTVAANSYRGLAIVTWISRRFLEKDDPPSAILPTILPALAATLWICSNSFIAFVWYPLLKRENPVKAHSRSAS